MKSMRIKALIGILCLTSLFGAQARNAKLTDLKVMPPNANLTTLRDRQPVVIQAIYADGITEDVSAQAKYTLADPKLAKFENHALYPIADGKTEMKIEFGGRTLKLPVTVAKAKEDRPISFKLDVMPVFMKSGCNSGPCHGSSRGKDGFRLSLFGFDPDGDYDRLTREFIGRRINLALPEDSLMMAKSVGSVQHTGGALFTKDSEYYDSLLRWLKAGVPKDAADVAKAVSIEIFPKQVVLEGEGAKQRLTVRATYSDGTDRDITHLAAIVSNNDVSVLVSTDGVLTGGSRGEAFILARYDTFAVGTQVLVIPKGLEFTFPDVKPNNYVDELVYAKLKKLRISPSELGADSVFLRRVYLDIIGKVPTPKEIAEFEADISTGKRERVISELIDRTEFADMWVMKWGELLRVRSQPQNGGYFSVKNTKMYYDWLREQIVNNVPVDKMVKELLASSGPTFKNPAANYYKLETQILATSENVAQVFMGMRIQCAQCHNHPFDRWTMDDYYSFAAFFTQVGRKRGEDPRDTIVYNSGGGEQKHPVTKKNSKPKFLGGEYPEIKAGQDRRAILAEWIASPKNPYFARNLVNIVWAHFMGRGIIEPVDDVRISNPPSNPELLDELARRFSESNYDFKQLTRDICSSRTYQLSTQGNASNESDTQNFTKGSIRRMRAEVMFDAINNVTENTEKFSRMERGKGAVQIYDGRVSNYFLSTFGRAKRDSVCSCEVVMDPSLSQALHLLNGDTVNNKVVSGAVVKKLLAAKKTPREITDELYLRTFARKPTAAEWVKLEPFFKDEKKLETTLNDLFWSLLNSKEFMFNH
ncbi:MAG: hypothetical protein ACI8QF_001958 [Limisphaerales bacterium]|jgi:hypothetical protein